MRGSVLLGLWACQADRSVSSPRVPCADGTELAVDVILPDPVPEGGVPTVLITTRYWRSFQLRFQRGPRAFPIGPRDDAPEALVDAGYAVVVVDARGTGASDGVWVRPWTEAEVADQGAMIDWIVAQGWSDGRVGTYGVSYEGTTALLAAAAGRPALKAVLARQIEWDLVDELLAPGGVRNVGFVDAWERTVVDLDAGRYPELFPGSARWVVRGPRRTDDDPDGVALAARLAARPAPSVVAAVADVRAPEDPFGDGPAARDVGPAGWVDALRHSDAAIAVWGSWWDGATADAVLRADAELGLADARIGPWNHEGTESESPLGRPGDASVTAADVVAYFDDRLRGEAARARAGGTARAPRGGRRARPGPTSRRSR